MLGMAKRDESRRHAARCGKLLNTSGKNQERFAGRLFADADVAPAYPLPMVLALKYFSNYSREPSGLRPRRAQLTIGPCRRVGRV
jgi:hypothetical protein